MDSLLRANTLRLEEHADIIRREQRTVRLLVEQLPHAQRCALPDDAWRYDQMIRSAGKLERYFGGMVDQVDNMGFELARLSVEINAMLKDAGNQLKGLEQ